LTGVELLAFFDNDFCQVLEELVYLFFYSLETLSIIPLIWVHSQSYVALLRIWDLDTIRYW